MKKTLVIACSLLLAAVTAQAESLTLPSADLLAGSSATITTGNQALSWSSTDVASTLDSWMITFTLQESSTNTSSHWPAISVVGSDAYGLSIMRNNNGDFLFSKGGTSTGSNPLSDDVHLTATQGDTFAFAFDSVTNTAYLANITDSNAITLVSYTLTSEEAVSLNTSLVSGTSRTWTNSGYQEFVFDKVTDMNQAATAGVFEVTLRNGGAMPIPEPATATLSLLALAGLAARRRRK